MTLSAGTRLSGYEILGSLGAGGMGEVYRARDSKLAREVAIKVLPREFSADPDRRRRFEREARAASALNHPNIVTIHDVAEVDGASLIVMELVPGSTLREVLAAGPLPLRRLLAIAAQIADGLARAHEAGIVHRDVKPENVMITRDGLVKILDFGLAKRTETGSGGGSHLPTETGTSAGTVLGTVGYMSPEQASGQPADFRSDQFSFGSILYEMAGGKRAFARATAAETLSAIIREEPEPLERLRPDLPAPLRWIVERCLEKDPDRRYAATRDLARDFAALREHASEVSAAAAGPPPVARARARSALLLPALAIPLALVGGALLARSLWKDSSAAPSFHRLTFRRGALGNARFARDGRTVLYGADWEGEARSRRLYATTPDSPESRTFDFPRDADILAVSPSGELAILWGGQSGTLARVPLAGGLPREVLENVPYASADWDPAGRELAVVHLAGGKSRLEYPIGTVLAEAATPILVPRFSPSGDRISYFERPDRAAVGAIDPDGKNRQVLSTGWSTLEGAPCWGRGGREIWFTGSRGGVPEALFAVDRNGRERLVMRVPGSLELDDIAPDGRVLLAHHTVVWFVMGLAPGESSPRDLTWLDASFPAALSSDGKTLLLTEAGEGSGGTPAIYLRGTDGSPAVRLGEGTALALSPDQKWVLAAVGSSGLPKLALLPTGAGKTRILADGGFSSFQGAAFSPDGRRVFFSASRRAERPRVYAQEIESGNRRPLGPEGLRTPIFVAHPLSPDGRWLLVGDGSRRVSRLSTEEGSVHPFPELDGLSIAGWTSDSRNVYALDPSDPAARVWRLDFETGAKQLFTKIERSDSQSALRIMLTPDGRSYVYRTRRVVSELYLVEGLK